MSFRVEEGSDGHGRWVPTYDRSRLRPSGDGSVGIVVVEGMHLAWRLPRRAASVSEARQLIDSALSSIDVAEDCRGELGLIVTEACSNVVRHARSGADYLLTVAITGDLCVIEVIDSGVGLDHRNGGAVTGSVAFPPASAERGRGLLLIRAYADTFEFRPAHPRGLAVRMSKRLVWNGGGPAAAGPNGGNVPGSAIPHVW